MPKSIIRVAHSYIGRYLSWIVGTPKTISCCCLTCPPCSGNTPQAFEVQSAGWTNADCTQCLDWNATFILDLNGPGDCLCSWSYADPIKCTGLPASNTDGVFLKMSDAGSVPPSAVLDVGFAHNAVIACTDGACNYHFSKLVALPIDCTTIDTTLPFSSSGCLGFSAQCNVPDSITLRAL